MIIKCEIDTDHLYNGDGDQITDMEGLLSDAFRRSVVEQTREKLGSDHFKKISQLTSDTIVSEIKLKMESFLSEEIALTERWGKPTFVGSIEDLIKLRFDEIILKRVDNYGKKIEGCTSEGKTWLEWRIEQDLDKKMKSLVEQAQKTISLELTKLVKDKLIEIKNESLKSQVDDAFARILTAETVKEGGR